MNSVDYNAFFRPGEGAQAPLLFTAISAARATGQIKASQMHVFGTIEDTINQIDTFLKDPPKGNAAYYARKNMRERYLDPLKKLLITKQQVFIDAGFSGSWDTYENACTTMISSVLGDGSIDAIANDVIREQLNGMQTQLVNDRTIIRGDNSIPIGVDSPVHFDFDQFVTTIFTEVLSREAEKNPNLRSYVDTLQLRLEQARQDPRYSFLFRVPPFSHALASFLRLLFGLEPNRNFSDSPPPWKQSYEEGNPNGVISHQITILDLSQLASEVLENVTALLGRLVLEFMQRNPDRGRFPVVLILEEAHITFRPMLASNVSNVRVRCSKKSRKKVENLGSAW